MLCVSVVLVGLVARFRGLFRAVDGWGEISRCFTRASYSLDIYTVCFSPARPATVAMSRKLGVNVPWASLLCWSEQRQSCELERGSSSIADNPCLVTESTYIVTAQGRYNPAHTLFFF